MDKVISWQMPPVKIAEYIFFFLMDDVSSGEIRQEFVFFSLVSTGFLIFPFFPPSLLPYLQEAPPFSIDACLL